MKCLCTDSSDAHVVPVGDCCFEGLWKLEKVEPKWKRATGQRVGIRGGLGDGYLVLVSCCSLLPVQHEVR